MGLKMTYCYFYSKNDYKFENWGQIFERNESWKTESFGFE